MHVGETATEAGGMHPTGMHSCLKSFPLMDSGVSVTLFFKGRH